jgi:hypothetical protein
MTIYYGDIRALIDPAQSDQLPDGGRLQDISVILIDDWEGDPARALRPCAVTLAPQRARELAFELLALAEHAERIGQTR